MLLTHGPSRHDRVRFCDGPALLGRPYCAEHVCIAYVPRNTPAAASDTTER